MKRRDPIADALATLEVPPLDVRFATRIGAIAKAELRAPAQRAPSMVRLRWTFRVGLVPALLTLAAIAQTVTTANTIAQIYGKDDGASSQ